MNTQIDKWEGLIPRPSVDIKAAEIANDEIDAVEKKHKGPEFLSQVVESAKKSNSPLHNYFEWNNKKAGGKFRIIQAGYLVHSVKIVLAKVPVKSPSVIPIISVKKAASGELGIKTISSGSLKNQMLEKFMDDFNRFLGKYESLKELTPIYECYRDVRNNFMEGRL